MKQKNQWHIQTRVLTVILVLIVLLLLMVAVLFNSFLRAYIRSSVESQLNALTIAEPERHGGGGGGSDEPAEKASGEPPASEEVSGTLPDLSGQKNSRVGTTANVFVLNSDYTVLQSAEGENETAADVAAGLAHESANLSDIKNFYLSAEKGNYYVSTISNMLGKDAYMVFYVDVTGIMSFTGTVNVILFGILLAAVVLSVFAAKRIARSFTNTVEDLSAYAGRIGQGQFEGEKPVFRDIEFNYLAQSLEDMAAMLAAAQKKQNVFFQNVSHELRTPLMSIRCYAEGIQCGVMEPEKSSTTILAETDRLSTLVEDLLYISRIDSEQRVTNAELRDLRETLSVSIAGQRSVAENSGITFQIQFDEQPVMMAYHEKDMYQVFANLLSNALRYARSQVTVCCGTENGDVYVSVRDDGPGISQEDLPHIFERFYKGAGGKHGIGLSIVKSVVELYGGCVQTESDDGGTLFSLRFACVKELPVPEEDTSVRL